jgi:hypothetical protein
MRLAAALQQVRTAPLNRALRLIDVVGHVRSPEMAPGGEHAIQRAV